MRNDGLALVKVVADQRAAKRSYGVPGSELAPALGWSLPELHKDWNQPPADHVAAARCAFYW